MSFLKWLGLDEGPDQTVDSVAEIERSLTALPPADARFVACFAYILHRVARADHVVTDQETTLIEQLVAERAGLDPARAAIVAKIAHTEGLRHGGTEDFIVSRQFASIASREQKLALLDCLFAVSASDESIRTIEDNEIRRITSEIKLDHSDYIQVRSTHVHHLESRKRRPSGSE